MMIKELKDALVLVEQLPPDWQMKCVRRLSHEIRHWEERIQEPHMSDVQYRTLQNQRYEQAREERHKRRRKKRGW
jgi:hypothetical protein